jgi:hypothetical protein
MCERDYYEDDGLMPDLREEEESYDEIEEEKYGVCGICGDEDYVEFDYEILGDICGHCRSKRYSDVEDEV